MPDDKENPQPASESKGSEPPSDPVKTGDNGGAKGEHQIPETTRMVPREEDVQPVVTLAAQVHAAGSQPEVVVTPQPAPDLVHSATSAQAGENAPVTPTDAPGGGAPRGGGGAGPSGRGPGGGGSDGNGGGGDDGPSSPEPNPRAHPPSALARAAASPAVQPSLERLLTQVYASGERFLSILNGLISPPGIVAIILILSMFFISSIAGDASRLTSVEFSRGLITLLFSVGTIVAAVILVFAAIFQGDANEKAADRFNRAKEVLSLLIGIFGTILGFYFGSANDDTVRRKAMTAIETLGGEVSNSSVYMDKPGFHDQDLVQLRRLPKVEYLHLDFSGITDRGLLYLYDLKDLKQLTVRNTALHRKDLLTLKSLIGKDLRIIPDASDFPEAPASSVPIPPLVPTESSAAQQGVGSEPKPSTSPATKSAPLSGSSKETDQAPQAPPGPDAGEQAKPPPAGSPPGVKKG
jgi:hypothetical protein